MVRQRKTFYASRIIDESTDSEIRIDVTIFEDGEFSELITSRNYSNAKKKRSERTKKWQKENREKHRASVKRYRKNQPEKVKEKERIWRKNNPDKVREYNKRHGKKYRENYPDRIREKNRKYQENNPEKIREKQSRYYYNNHDKALAKAKRYRENHPDRFRKATRKWMAKTKWFSVSTFKDESTGKIIRISVYFDSDGNSQHLFNCIDLENTRRIVREANKRFRRENPEAYKAIVHRRRELGFIPLNAWFRGSQAHHIDEEHVIYIPAEIHRSFPHCLESGEGMAEINEVAFRFLESERRQVSKLEEYVEV